MKVAQGITEAGVVVGNTYDKYHSSNPVVRRLMQGYEASLTRLVEKVKPGLIHEVGCGEGYWTMKWQKSGINAAGSDFSDKVIGMARNNAQEAGLSPEKFMVRNIYQLDPQVDRADLVVCCEVLEHLERPEEALTRLQLVADPYLIVCVPREPVWRVLNMIRGKYIRRWGNTPGHIQHWTQKEFMHMVSRYFEIIEAENPFPWSMMLCRVKSVPAAKLTL